MTSVGQVARARMRAEYQRLYGKSADTLDIHEVVNAVYKGTAQYLEYLQVLGDYKEGLRVVPPNAEEYYFVLLLFCSFIILFFFYFVLFLFCSFFFHSIHY